MKSFILQTIMNSSIHFRAAIPVARHVAAFVCLVWLAVPGASLGQQSNVLQKVDLLQEVAMVTASDPQTYSLFGGRIAISGDTMVVGTAHNSAPMEAAYVFVREGTNWTQQQKLTASDGGNGFGCSVAISSNTIVVGAWLDDNGAAYVFVRSGTTWTLQQKLLPGTVNRQAEFGWSVAVSGDTIAVGDRYSPPAGDPWDLYRGAAYIFGRAGTTWTQKQRMIGPIQGDYSFPDSFGYSIAVSGDTCVVGRSDDFSGDVPGKAYVFVRQGTTWPATPTHTLNASDGVAGGRFGESVAISSNTIVIGAFPARKAYVFERAGSAWPLTQTHTLTPINGVAGDEFGYSVAVNGDAIVIGAKYTGQSSGSAQVFLRSGSIWRPHRKLTASDSFGESVAVTGDTIVVGASPHDQYRGSAYIFGPGYGNDINVDTYVRKLLYAPEAATSPYFNPLDAAFLYKHRLYGWGTNAQGANVIQPQFEHVSDYWPGPNGVYLTRSREAEVELRRGLAANPASDVLGHLLLDIYYDRTVADALFARGALAYADKSRFGGPGLTIAPPPEGGSFVIEKEIDAYERALCTNRLALSNYVALLRDPSDTAIFGRLVPSRGLSVATYCASDNWNPLPVAGGDPALFAGYKDLVLIYGLLRDYGQTALRLARLHAARQDESAATELITGTQRFLFLQSSVWRGFFPSLTLPASDTSGLAEAMAGVNNSLAELDAVRQSLGGQVNPLGFANDFLMFVQRRSSEPNLGYDTFDILKALLDPGQSSSALKTALDELLGQNGLEASYRLFRDSQDEMAAQFADSSIAYNDRLRDIVGVFPDNSLYTDLATANPGSELDLQYRKIELARNQILHNQTQMDNLTKQVQIEIDKATSLSNIVVKYAAKRAAITEKIGHLNAAQAEINGFAAACSPENFATGGAIASLVNGGAQATGEEMKVQLEAEKDRLAGDEQAEIFGAELNATVKGFMLDMNIVLVESREAALTLQQEVNGLQALYREKQDLERRLVQRDNRLSRRYFADPVHRLSVQAGMVRADQSFEQAQRSLFFMVRALEYKYNEPFQEDNAPDGRLLWTSTDIYQLRNATELQDCYNAMKAYDDNKTVVWGDPDWDVFSLRKNAYGYLAGTNAQGQPLRYVVDLNGSPSQPLDATNAFRARLWQQVTDTGNGPELVLHFNTAHTVGNLFLGPTFTTNQPPTPTRNGTYLDKISELRIRLAGNHSLPDGEVSQVSLTYGGTSYIRKPVVGEYAPDRPDRLCNETTTYSTRFWQNVGSPPRWEAIEALRVEGQKALRSRNSPPPREGPTIKTVIEFSDRSVAASDWTLTIPLVGSEGASFLIDELDDIEIYFLHRAATRTQTQ